MHVSSFVEAIENGTGNISHALCNYPHEGRSRQAIDQRFKSYQHAKAHADETECLYVAVIFQFTEAGHSAYHCTKPHKDEKTPPPIALVSQGYERYRRIRAGNMPVNSGMIPLAQPLFPFGIGRQGMVNGRSRIRTYHAEKVENNRCSGPRQYLRRATTSSITLLYARSVSSFLGGYCADIFVVSIINAVMIKAVRLILF